MRNIAFLLCQKYKGSKELLPDGANLVNIVNDTDNLSETD
jgi:hypothetical protein